MKRSCLSALSALVTIGALSGAMLMAPAPSLAVRPAVKDRPAAKAIPDKAYQPVTALDLAQNPEKYVSKRVVFEGAFSSFSSLGLDYKPAMRASKQYVSLLIIRPDITHHKIPLSELKLFYPREKSESVMNLEAGDVISVKGHVFSAALRDPWVDAESITVVRKAKPDPDKACGLDNC
ncbi:MAG: hypothetical protein IPK79_03080 [Vampirovibrionales bacterium]|nr:hypothetical protein [Vampirovibrionales bacterium]